VTIIIFSIKLRENQKNIIFAATLGKRGVREGRGRREEGAGQRAQSSKRFITYWRNGHAGSVINSVVECGLEVHYILEKWSRW